MLVRFLNVVKHDHKYYSGDCEIDEELARTFISNGWAMSLEPVATCNESTADEEPLITDWDIRLMNRNELMHLCSKRGIKTTFRDTAATMKAKLGVKNDGNK